METVITIESVQRLQTRGGNTRYVVGGSDGNQYATFREGIGEAAADLEGRRVRIQYHEERRGQYRNVYLDKVESVRDDGPAKEGSETDPEEAAWRTAVDAAPWLVGESDPHAKTSPDDLYQTLKPFKDKVAEDIKDREDDQA